MTRYRLMGLGAGVVAIGVTLALAGPAAAATSTLLPPTISADSSTFTIGTAAKFTFGTPSGSDDPVRFVYQLNVGAPVGVDATNGRAMVSIVPDRFTDVLSVFAVGPDGAVSGTTTEVFNAVYPPPAADQDLTGDGKPDLLTVGGTPGLASGLWLAPGKTGSGAVSLPAVNIGINGNGVVGDDSPADFDGAQVISGKFTGVSFEDVLVYYPSGFRAGSGMVIAGNGHGNPLNPRNERSMFSGMLSDLNGDDPIQLANAYNSAGSGFAFPDLFGIVGDPTNGYTLDYYPNLDGAGMYDLPIALTLPTPTGGTDWQNWRISSKLLPSGTALALWNPTTGGLYLWEGVTFSGSAGEFGEPGSGTLTFTQYTLAATWQPTPTPSALQLTDVNGDGVPDLWAVSPAGDVTAYVVSELSTTAAARLKVQPTQNLS
jgi:hypothetical protein